MNPMPWIYPMADCDFDRDSASLFRDGFIRGCAAGLEVLGAAVYDHTVAAREINSLL